MFVMPQWITWPRSAVPNVIVQTPWKPTRVLFWPPWSHTYLRGLCPWKVYIGRANAYRWVHSAKKFAFSYLTSRFSYLCAVAGMSTGGSPLFWYGHVIRWRTGRLILALLVPSGPFFSPFGVCTYRVRFICNSVTTCDHMEASTEGSSAKIATHVDASLKLYISGCKLYSSPMPALQYMIYAHHNPPYTWL